jgi:2-methylcitrate dehydratase PrpD
MSATEELLAFVQGLDPSSMPGDVVAQAKRCVLDLLGVAIAGSRTEMARASTPLAYGQFGPGRATLIGSMARLVEVGATWGNGISASALDMDDGHRLAMGHPGAAVIPTALAVAETQGTSGGDFLAAVVAGYEVAVRVSVSRVPAFKHDHYSTGIWGAPGSAAAAGKLLGFDRGAYQSALGIAIAHSPFPPSGAFTFGGMVKEVIGWAGVVGCTSALLAQEGFAGPSDALDQSGRYDPAQLVADLGQRYAICQVYFKPYASCRWSHPAIDGVLHLTREHDLKPAEIERIHVEGFREITRLRNPIPATPIEAQYSLPFSIALALIYRGIGPAELQEDKLHDRALLEMAQKVKLSVDPEFVQAFPAKTALRVTIHTARGVFATTAEYPRGNPENPLSDAELSDKFLGLTAEILGEKRSGKLEKAVGHLDQLDNVRHLTEFLAF